MHQLTGKKKFAWTEQCQQAFDLARKKLAKATVMAFPSMKQEDTYFLRRYFHKIDYFKSS